MEKVLGTLEMSLEERNYVLTNGMWYICVCVCVEMNDIVVFVWIVLFEDLWVWISGMKDIYVYMCEMQFVVDVAIEDFNWYVMIMMIMMILIWDDVVNKDHVNMNCYYWWICEYEMRLLLLLITSLRWDDIYVVNDMEMECWLMLEMHWHVHVVYVRGGHCALTFQGLWH